MTKLKAKRVQPENVQRHTLTVSELATIYGCCGLFDLCGDSDLVSLTMQGSSPFFDWLMWVGTDECIIEKDFITWVRPDEGASRQGWLSDPCAEPNSVEFGTCTFRYTDFARLRRKTPELDITKDHVRLCDRQPRYRLDGSMVDSDLEFRALLAVEGISQDVHSMAIIGNRLTAGQFDGLERIVRTGYTDFTGKRCSVMDSIVINWNGNGTDGGAGVTWSDGRGTRNVSAAYNFIDVLRSAYRVIKQRIGMSPTLASQRLTLGDMILLATSDAAECILDAFTCWSVCPGQQFNEANINTLEGREYRNNLDGGLFGDGRIFLHGFEIPILKYDWELQKGPTLSDVYLLTRGVGNVLTLQGQYNNMQPVPSKADKFFVSDGGRFLHWDEDDETCVSQRTEFQPRIIGWAPWSLVRFQNFRCDTPGGHISPDPLETSWFPETSFSVATC